MKLFDYVRPADEQGALAGLGTGGYARFLGGGTNLVDLMKLGVETPDVLVDVTRLPLGDVTSTADGRLRIGATVRNSDLAAETAVRAGYPVLSEALLAGASGQLRNMATVGGNLLQRTRCRYFQDVSKPCNKRVPGSGCPAVEGEHHNLAVLGSSDLCVATHPSDMAVALLALDAVVHYETSDGSGSMPVDDFYRIPGGEPQRDTNLPAGALITAVELPPTGAGQASVYRKVRERASYAFAVVSVAAVIEVEDGVVSSARLALGGVAHRPWRARRAEELLASGPAAPDAFRRAIDAELAQARPLRDNAYKVGLARDVAVGVLCELTGAEEAV